MPLDILIVDDERDIRDLVAGVLSDEGYSCRTAADSTSALAAVDERRPSLVLLDVDDMPLRRFLSDLPAHTLPATRLLGSLAYSAEPEHPDRLEVMLRHDAIVGNEREALLLTGAASLDEAIAIIRAGMVGSNLRAAVISRGANGATAFTSTPSAPR